MSEDEVAIMVKNALRKARRAMHSSSPAHHTGGASGTTRLESGRATPVSAGGQTSSLKGSSNTTVDIGATPGKSPPPAAAAAATTTKSAFENSNTHSSSFEYDNSKQQETTVSQSLSYTSTTSTATNNSFDNKFDASLPVDNTSEDDLARRIEEEIKGARAFAEKVYYGGGKYGAKGKSVVLAAKPSSPNAGASGGPFSTKMTEHVTNASPRPSAINTTAPGGTTSSARVSPQVSPKERVARSKEAISAAGEKLYAGSHQRPPMSPQSPAPKPDEGDELMGRRNKENQQMHQSPRTPHSTVDSPGGALSPSTTQNTFPNTNNQNQPREHRQVVFRHPYPLPPPPILPRSDQMIIAENSVREKEINIKTVEPDHDLLQLIQAAEDDTLIRRSNACGALKVLASKDNNKVRLCRTKGLLDALVTASMDDAVDSDALDARTRAVTTLLYLSEPKDNRLIVARHPQVLQVLIKVIEEDTGEARLRACSALATLAKTPQNRGLICSTERLAEVLSGLMVEGVAENEDAKREEAAKADLMIEDESIERICSTAESRDDPSLRDDDATMESFVSEDERLLTNTFSGTFSGGTGTFTEDDFTYQSEDLSVEGSMAEGSTMSQDDDDGSHSTASAFSDDDGSEQEEEEGVEMQISSLKKLNIENSKDFLARSQLSACATLTHLTKHCANAVSYVVCTIVDDVSEIVHILC
jgi:hypothetical protein